MKLPKLQIDEHIVSKIARQHEIIEVSVFGSSLREDFHEESDIDLLIEFAPDTHHSYFDILQIKDDFEGVLNHPIDIIEKKGLRNPYRRKTILSSAQVIYAS